MCGSSLNWSGLRQFPEKAVEHIGEGIVELRLLPHAAGHPADLLRKDGVSDKNTELLANVLRGHSI